MTAPATKAQIRQAILDKLQAELEVTTRAALMARDEATNEESKASSKYETHGQEAAYLAETQSKLASELQASLALYTTLPLPEFAAAQSADIGALISLEYRGRTTWYFLGPRNGGLAITLGDTTITLVTPQSPLGRQLQGARVGATVQLPGRTGTVAHTVVLIV